MRKLIALGSVLVVVAMPAPSAADPGHGRPKITVFEFLQPALKSQIDEKLRVVAHDPDSWISEIEVRTEDEAGNVSLVFANTGCVQDPDFSDSGTIAKLTIPVYFENPGRYHVEVRAISEFHCDGSQHKISRTLEQDVVVSDPLTTAADPDDVDGDLDIASIEQTQESSEFSATTEVIHRIKTYQSWTNDHLGGPSFVHMFIDLDGDATSFERIVTVDLDDDGALYASVVDPRTGQNRGYARATRPDDTTLEVAMPPLLLKKDLRSYRWYATTVYIDEESCTSEDPCTDLAPDANLMRHRL